MAMLLLVNVQDVTRGQAPKEAAEGAYRSPYSLKLTFPRQDLVGDIEEGRRGDLREESSLPFAEWSSLEVRKRYGPWGPPARHYPAPLLLARRSAAWKRERVLAVALRFEGYAYQHHHIPDWDPPADWPWKETAHGRNSKGIDCSNFVSFAYNQALGIKLNSAIHKLAELTEVAGPGGVGTLRLERVTLPGGHAGFGPLLRTGDLLFIRNTSDEVAHVVLWVGSIGQAPDQLPLILDSTSAAAHDSNGAPIPSGVRLRPFREKSWYHHKASHALRVIAEE
jgi:cell wall-associated NlpC family hydrolase